MDAATWILVGIWVVLVCIIAVLGRLNVRLLSRRAKCVAEIERLERETRNLSGPAPDARLTGKEIDCLHLLGESTNLLRDIVGNDPATRDHDLNEMFSRIHDVQARERRTHPGRASRGTTVQSPRTGSGTKLPSSERGCRPPTGVRDTPKRHETTLDLTHSEIIGSPARGHTSPPTTQSGRYGVR